MHKTTENALMWTGGETGGRITLAATERPFPVAVTAVLMAFPVAVVAVFKPLAVAFAAVLIPLLT